MGLSYEDLIAPTIVKQVSKSVAYCRCTRSKNLPFCDGSHAVTSIRPHILEFDEPRPSPSVAAGSRKTTPTATAPMDDWSNPKSARRVLTIERFERLERLELLERLEPLVLRSIELWRR